MPGHKMYKKTLSKVLSVSFLCVSSQSWVCFFHLCDKIVLPSAGPEELVAPAGCDVALSSEGSEIPPGWCVVIRYC